MTKDELYHSVMLSKKLVDELDGVMDVYMRRSSIRRFRYHMKIAKEAAKKARIAIVKCDWLRQDTDADFAEYLKEMIYEDEAKK